MGGTLLTLLAAQQIPGSAGRVGSQTDRLNRRPYVIAAPPRSSQSLTLLDLFQYKAMGTYFTAVVDHNLDEDNIHTLPDLLNSTWHEIEHQLSIIEGYPLPGCSPAKWQWGQNDGGFSLERLHHRGGLMVEGHEFHGFATERVFKLSHGVRWWSFISEQIVRDKLLRACRHTASVLGSNQIIYLPSGFLKPEGAIGLIFEGKAVEEMIDWLRENCGPPIRDIESIHRGEIESWNENGYYIDRI